MIKNHSADLELLIQAQVGNEDKFMALFDCYSSLVKRLWQKFYIADLEFEDWDQEKQSLVNRLLDLYRARQADKRIPVERLDSLGENDSETILGGKILLEDIVYCHKSIEEIIRVSSSFERDVLALTVTGKSVEYVCRKLQCNKRQVQSALSRTRTKLIKILAGE